jgi:predicted anti-sigma-YlaC factor YlaD
MAMNCRRIQKKLSAFQDGELNADERVIVSMHLQNCPFCRSVYADMEEAWQSLNVITEIEPSPGFNRDLYRKIHTAANQHQRQWFPWLLQLFPTPAATMAILLIGVLLGAFLGNSIVTVGPLSIGNQISYSQTLREVDFFKAFDPTPPDTLGNNYIIMASATEEYPK